MPSGRAKALIVGVYPSAFHVKWHIPKELDDRTPARRRLFVSSLAVDVEPTVFWDGKSPAPEKLLKDWEDDCFKSEWGTVRPGSNGPSGVGLLNTYLAPLRLGANQVAMTDVVPWYFAKGGSDSQGAAIDRLKRLNERLNLGIDAGDLPKRPSPRDLVRCATSEPRRSALRREVLDAGAERVITLGQEALDALRGVADGVAGVQAKLTHGDDYGREGTLKIDGHELRLIPLVHPGRLRQTAAAGEGERASWRATHDAWCAAIVKG
jgi:hypothetical protein